MLLFIYYTRLQKTVGYLITHLLGKWCESMPPSSSPQYGRGGRRPASSVHGGTDADYFPSRQVGKYAISSASECSRGIVNKFRTFFFKYLNFRSFIIKYFFPSFLVICCQLSTSAEGFNAHLFSPDSVKAPQSACIFPECHKAHVFWWRQWSKDRHLNKIGLKSPFGAAPLAKAVVP